MLTQKNKKAVVLTALILISFVFVIYAEDNSGIDPDKIKQSPFAQFAGNKQTPNIEPNDKPRPELFVETATLKFLNAKSLKASIERMSSEYGDMEPDAKGNSLIICDTQENLARILEQIRKADRKPDQIMIEVVIVDVKLDNETEIGVNWDMLTTKYNVKLDNHSHVGSSFRQNLGFTDRVSSVQPTTDNIENATSFNTAGAGSDFSLLFGDIRNVIHALQAKNNIEIIASPRVMVVSGKNAIIKAVEQIPYQERSQTSQGGDMTSTQFKDVGVTLDVGATLTDDKFISLDVKTSQDVATSVDSVSGVPTVDRREIESSLLLKDGQILVIGGLRRKTTQKQTNQIPILGDLPIVGYAFKATDTVQNNSELLVILSPHIYNDENDKLADVEMEKYNEITQRPLLTIPEVVEKKQEEEKEKAGQTKEAEKAKKAEEAREAKEAKKAEKVREAREAKEAKKAEEAKKKAEEAKKKAEEANKKAEEANRKAEEANRKAKTAEK